MRLAALTLALVVAVTACTGEPFESAVPDRGGAQIGSPDSDPGENERSDEPSSEPNSPTTAVETTTSTPAPAPESLPLVENPIAPSLPEGLTVADLPDEPGDRLGLLTEWLESNYAERSSGHAFSGFDGSFDLRFNINETDGLYARALCPFYVELAGLYMSETDHTVALHGWVRDESGRYEDAEWETIAC